MSAEVIQFEPKVTIKGDTVVTTSMAIAEHFGKRHRDVARAIREAPCSAEFGARNFARTSFTDRQGKQWPMYEVSRDGFVFVAMGFTGEKAAKWKEAYITAFNAMEAELTKRHGPGLPEVEALAEQVGRLRDENQELKDELLGIQRRYIEAIDVEPRTRRDFSEQEKSQMLSMARAGYAGAAIADELGRPKGSVHSCVSRARKEGRV